MSKPIADSDVTAVLLADGWHTVAPRTFELQPRGWRHELGATPAATAFCFTTCSGCRVAGPVTSVLATESRPRTEAAKRPPRDVEHGRLAVEDLRAHPWPLDQATVGARVAGCALRNALDRRRSEVLAYWIPLPDAEGAR